MIISDKMDARGRKATSGINELQIYTHRIKELSINPALSRVRVY